MFSPLGDSRFLQGGYDDDEFAVYEIICLAGKGKSTNLIKAKCMSRCQSQNFYGLIIALTGVFISFLSASHSRTLQYILAIGMIVAALFAFLAAQKCDESEIPLRFNLLHAIGAALYALAIIVVANSFERFITFTYIYLLYFGVIELIFGIFLFHYRNKVSVDSIFIRMVIGIFISIGAASVLLNDLPEEGVSLITAGALLVLSGVNFMFLARQVSRYEYY